ncbi:glycosyltransferase family 2 protein [Methylobacter sp. Wu1]|uniref:glycosyltransferase family 2 protein n=1 Tax=Methylobacter sp. Wu1 TaxID=3119359 RepID=UPI002F95D987
MDDSQLRLVVIIINYKTPQLVCYALTSLAGQIDKSCDRAVVVDNKSQDNSVAEILNFVESKQWTSWVNVIPSEVNGGFSAGNNLGIQSAKAKYYLLLNSDAFVRDNAINELLNAAEANPGAGIIGPKLEWSDGQPQTSCFYNLTPWNEFLKAASTGILSKTLKYFDIHEVAMPICSSPATPEWISFACVLIQAKVIDDIGLMDDGYFMYREDNDYCRRARNAGWKILYWPLARVVHLNQGYSNSKKIVRLPAYYYMSRSRYFLKYYGRSGLFAANVLWILGRGISLLREFIERKQPVVHPNTWKDIWIGSLSKFDFRVLDKLGR